MANHSGEVHAFPNLSWSHGSSDCSHYLAVIQLSLASEHLCANVFYIIWMIVLEMLITCLWYFVHGALLNRVEEHDFYFVAVAALDSLVVVLTFISQADWRACSRRSSFANRVISSRLPLPIDLEGTGSRCPSVGDEEGVQCTAATCLELASRLRLSAMRDMEEQRAHSEGVSTTQRGQGEAAPTTTATSLKLAGRLHPEFTKDAEKQRAHSEGVSAGREGTDTRSVSVGEEEAAPSTAAIFVECASGETLMAQRRIRFGVVEVSACA